MKKSIFLSLFLILIFSTPLFAYDIIKIGYQNDVKTLNYWKASDIWSTQVLNMVYESLYVYAPETYNITAWLADGQPQIDYENLTVEIKLRKNVKWSDGKSFTADDVVFTANVHINYKIPQYIAYWEFINEVEKIDDYTVKFYLKEMRATFIHGTLMSLILPKHIWEKIISDAVNGLSGETATRKILNINTTEVQTVGIGPFILKEWSRNQYLSMETNENYFMKGRKIQGRTKTFKIGPYVDGLLFRIYKSIDVAIEGIKNGDIDYIWCEIPVGYIIKLSEDPNLYLTKSDENGIYYLAFNLRKSPFKYKGFRQAMSWLIDRNYIEEKILMTYGKGMYTIVPPGNKAFYNPDVDDYGTKENTPMEERVEKAKTLLKSSGFIWDNGKLIDPDGKVVEPFYILVPPADYDPIRAQCSVLISDWWESVSVYAIPKPTSLAEIIDRTFTKRNFDAFILGWDLEIFPDYLRNIFHSSQDISDGRNPMGFNNNFFDGISDDFVNELDPLQQIQKAKKLQEVIAEECVYLPLYTKLSIEVHSRRFNVNDWIIQLDGTGNIWSFLFLKSVK